MPSLVKKSGNIGVPKKVDVDPEGADPGTTARTNTFWLCGLFKYFPCRWTGRTFTQIHPELNHLFPEHLPRVSLHNLRASPGTFPFKLRVGSNVLLVETTQPGKL